MSSFVVSEGYCLTQTSVKNEQITYSLAMCTKVCRKGNPFVGGIRDVAETGDGDLGDWSDTAKVMASW
jgi:hypothetical protein